MWPAVRLRLSPLSPDRSVGPSSRSRVLPAPGRMNPEFAPPSVGPGFRAPTHRLPGAGIPAPGIVTKLSWAHEVSGVPSLTLPAPTHPKPHVPAAAGRSPHLHAARRRLLLACPDPGAARWVPTPLPPPLPPPVPPPRLPRAAAPRLARDHGRRNPSPRRTHLPRAAAPGRTHRRREPAPCPALPAARRWGSAEPPGCGRGFPPSGRCEGRELPSWSDRDGGRGFPCRNDQVGGDSREPHTPAGRVPAGEFGAPLGAGFGNLGILGRKGWSEMAAQNLQMAGLGAPSRWKSGS